jgi:hypothetical protein
MNTAQGEDLGHGVYVSPSVKGEVIVISPRLALEWRVAEGQAPGSAVLWNDRSFEVIGREPAGAGDRWILRTWDDSHAMRTVYTLDRESVAWLAEGAAAEKRERRTRAVTMLLLPVLGLAPAALQKRWADSWEFVPSRATTFSALGEMVFGGIFLLELVAMTVGGSVILPARLQWLAYLGPVLLVSGIARLVLVFSDGDPVGSLLGMPLRFLVPRAAVAHEDFTPTVRRVGEDGRFIEIVSPIHRKDWDRDGTLTYGGVSYRLDRSDQEGRSWVYIFGRSTDGGDEKRKLSLNVPRDAPLIEPHTTEAPPSIVRTALVTTGVSLGPRSDQERWAAHLGINAIWLTVMSAGAELVGGITNLGGDLGSGRVLLVLIDFFLVGEGLLRLGSGVTGRPMGSVFGWVLRPLYRRYLSNAPPHASN